MPPSRWVALRGARSAVVGATAKLEYPYVVYVPLHIIFLLLTLLLSSYRLSFLSYRLLIVYRFPFSTFSLVVTCCFFYLFIGVHEVVFQRFFHFDSKGAKECAFCRARKMQKNGYLLTKIGVDTAENGPNSAEV